MNQKEKRSDKRSCEKIIDPFMEQYGRNANERDLDTYLYQEFTYGELKQYLAYFGTCGKRCKCIHLFRSMTRLANEPIHLNE